MKYLLLFMLAGCASRNHMKDARTAMFESKLDCLNTLRVNMENAGCKEMYFSQTRTSVTIRCKMPDGSHRNVWNSYNFRISSAKQALHPNDAEQIEKRTICIDDYTRIEAWKP